MSRTIVCSLPPPSDYSRNIRWERYHAILASYSLKRRCFTYRVVLTRQVSTPQILTGVFLRALLHHRSVLSSCPCVRAACPPRARILQERGAPGQASGQNISSSPASSTTISGSKARLTKTKVGLSTTEWQVQMRVAHSVVRFSARGRCTTYYLVRGLQVQLHEVLVRDTRRAVIYVRTSTAQWRQCPTKFHLPTLVGCRDTTTWKP